MRASVLLLSFMLALSATATAGEIHIAQCLKGCPTGTPDSNDLIVREIYALSSNDTTKFADWVAYRVTSETIGTSKALNREWAADPLLDPNETLEPDDYKNASTTLKIDRGHQAPLASFAGTVFWRETNFLSNITPQKKDLNEGAWQYLEAAVRDMAYKQGEVYVVTGPLYDATKPQMTLPKADEPHKVPTGYFKVVATASGAMTAFIFDQDTPRDANYCNFIKPLSDVEHQSGLDLFPEAPDWPTGNVNAALGCQ